MLSNKALKERLAKYRAIVLGVAMNDYGYWVVTYSPAPGLYLDITVCENGITSTEAVSRANATLTATTQQEVMT